MINEFCLDHSNTVMVKNNALIGTKEITFCSIKIPAEPDPAERGAAGLMGLVEGMNRASKCGGAGFTRVSRDARRGTVCCRRLDGVPAHASSQ